MRNSVSARSCVLDRPRIAPLDRPRISFQTSHRNMASSTDQILKGKYPAKEHARKVVEYIRSKEPNAEGLLYLEGQKTVMIEDNDEAAPFRYVGLEAGLFPVDGCWGSIECFYSQLVGFIVLYGSY